MLKNALQKAFLKAQNTYDKAAIIQNKMQEILLEILHRHQNCQNSSYSHSSPHSCLHSNSHLHSTSNPPLHFPNILELGCGRGGFSGKLAKSLTFNHFIALDLVDFSSDFLGKNIEFLQFDMENLEMIKNIYQNMSFDLIASNAALQWTNQAVILPKIAQIAHKNSCLLLGIFGKNNLKEMREFLGIGLEYLSLLDYQKILSQDWQILECFGVLETLHFQSPLEVFRHLKNTGVNVYGASFALTKSHLKSYEKHFQNALTYEPLYILAQKK